MDVSVKPTEMQNYTVQTKYLFLCSNIAPFIPLSGWTGRVLQVVGVLPAAPDVLHHQGRVKDNVCVGGKLQQGDSEMSHTNGTNSLNFLLFLKASVIFSLRIALGSYLCE